MEDAGGGNNTKTPQCRDSAMRFSLKTLLFVFVVVCVTIAGALYTDRIWAAAFFTTCDVVDHGGCCCNACTSESCTRDIGPALRYLRVFISLSPCMVTLTECNGRWPDYIVGGTAIIDEPVLTLGG